ncbi:MAG: peptidoglycan-binding protein [Clostridia bacterium]|nr:peptidoglycan-binding protein [Clostridia bacterium]
MKNTRALCALLALILCFGFVFAGCNKDGEYPVTVGHTQFKESPVKVVSLSDNIADIICYIGYATKLSGVSDSCTQSEIKEYITSVGSEISPNTDLIVNSGATVVFADSTLDEAVKTELQNKGVEVIKTLYPSNDAQLRSLYENIGTILGGNTEGRNKGVSAYDRLMSILTSATDEVASVASTKTVCYLYLENGKLCSFTGKYNDGMVMSYLGATNIAANFTSKYADESILKLSNPDYIFFDNASVMEKLTSDDNLKNLNAITKGNVFELSKDELTRQGESIIKVQNFMLSSMFPNFVDAPVIESEDLSSAYGITLTEDMSFKNGDDNDNIIAVQQRLVDLGFLDLGEDAPTTYFGDMSEEALKAFQSANSLEASGIASFETLKKLFSSDALGANGGTYVPETTAPQTEPETTTAENHTPDTPQSNNTSSDTNAPITITDSTVYQSGDEHEDIKAIQERLVELMYLSFDEGDSATTYYGAGTENAILTFQESNDLPQTGVADADTLRVLFSEDAKIPQ